MSDDQERGTPRLEGADLLGDVMHEALDQGEERSQEREPERRPAPSAPSGSSSYYDSLITQKRKEMKELAEKLNNHETNRAYVKKDQNGNEYINFPQMTADQARLTMLKQEIDDYREEATKRRETASQRFSIARERAGALARTEAAKVQDEALRQRIAAVFVELFNGVSDNRIWERARYANVANIDADINQLWESAVGKVYRERFAGNGKGAPASSGLDAQDEKPEREEEELDPFTNNLMYAYEKRKGRSMTFAEAKKARMEEEARAKEGGQR